MGLASSLWLVGTVLYLDMALGHEPTFYTLVMNNSSPCVIDNGDRPGAKMPRFLQQDSSYRSVICHRARVDQSVQEYALSFYKLLFLLLSDQSQPPIRGKPNLSAFLYTVAY